MRTIALIMVALASLSTLKNVRCDQYCIDEDYNGGFFYQDNCLCYNKYDAEAVFLPKWRTRKVKEQTIPISSDPEEFTYPSDLTKKYYW